MSEPPSDPPEPAAPPVTHRAQPVRDAERKARAERLAAALRDNLRRRKAGKARPEGN
jgi:hypothetical protein